MWNGKWENDFTHVVAKVPRFKDLGESQDMLDKGKLFQYLAKALLAKAEECKEKNQIEKIIKIFGTSLWLKIELRHKWLMPFASVSTVVILTYSGQRCNLLACDACIVQYTSKPLCGSFPNMVGKNRKE